MTIMSQRRKNTYNVAEAKARFSDLVRKAAAGEEVIIAKDNKPLVRLVELEEPRRTRRPGSAKGRVRVAADFDETPSEFKGYT
jgi:prevent-host-death family protein